MWWTLPVAQSVMLGSRLPSPTEVGPRTSHLSGRDQDLYAFRDQV